jgi:GcrA cell cycle regulator
MAEWTPAREEKLRLMWAEGKSASQIARELGGVTRNGVIGRVHRLGLGRNTREEVASRAAERAKRAGGGKKFCSVQGCGKPLSPKNLSAVCRDHAHAPGRCQCPKCRGEVMVRRAEPVARPDVRWALVPASGPLTCGGDAHIRVSLPREPWA